MGRHTTRKARLQSDRQTDRQAGKHTNRQARDRQTDRQANTWTDRHGVVTQTDMLTTMYRGRQTGRQPGIQADRQFCKQAER